MSWMFAAQLGLSLLQGSTQHSADKVDSKNRRAAQKRHNKLTRISDSLSQNAITTNEVLTMQASSRQAVDIKRLSLADQAKAEVFAAAAGVKGRSVNQTMLSIQRNASTAERNRQTELQNKFLVFDQQRKQSSFGADINQDYSIIPKPRASTYLFDSLASGVQSGIRSGTIGGSLPGLFSSGSSGSTVANPSIAGTQFLLD